MALPGPHRHGRRRRLSASLSALALGAAALLQGALPRAWVAAWGSRRALLGAVAGAASLPLAPVPEARAFENALPEVSKFSARRTPGDQPADLGLQVRKLNKFGDTSEGPALKDCGPGPNCFSTTFDPEDTFSTTAIKPWKVPAGLPATDAVAQLKEEIASYPPGQNGVDGGGFKIVTVKDDYLYAQFESLKKGKIDDTEFAVNKDGTVQVRSGGRLGRKADFGSNVKRLNYLSERLRAKGWTAPELTKDSHAYYFRMNSGKTKTQCVGINCPVNYELIKEEPGEEA